MSVRAPSPATVRVSDQIRYGGVFVELKTIIKCAMEVAYDVLNQL